MDKLEKIIKLLKPKYYNRITYLLVITGCSLLTKPLWLDILNAAIKSSNQNNKEIQITIIGNWDWVLGFLIIVLSLWWHTRNRLIDLKEKNHSMPEYKKVNEVIFNSFEHVCKAIYPILKDNEYIFKNVGPNSGARETEELRTDLTLWYKYRNQTIIPNNQKIKEILKVNENLIPDSASELSKQMQLHIDAFEEHVQNPEFDYSEYRFPLEFQQLIENTCFDASVNSSSILKQVKWLGKRLKKIAIEEWHIIGSVLFIPEKANDVDLVVLAEDNSLKESVEFIHELKKDFKLKYGYGLHPTIFGTLEKDDYKQFIAANNKKLKGNG